MRLSLLFNLIGLVLASQSQSNCTEKVALKTLLCELGYICTEVRMNMINAEPTFASNISTIKRKYNFSTSSSSLEHSSNSSSTGFSIKVTAATSTVVQT